VPHNNSERLYLSKRASVLSICFCKAKAGAVPASNVLILCSNFLTVAFNLLLKAGDSLHFVNPPISAEAILGVKKIKIEAIKVNNLKFFTKI